MSDQAKIDLATANVTVAEAQLTQGTLTAPMSGVVGLVTMATGDSVSASSADSAITIIGDAGYQVTTTVALDDIAKVAVGQDATITVPGSSDPLAGTVTRIGVLATDSTTSTGFDVTVELDPTDLTLYNGSVVGVSITVGEVTDALTVPTSAVHVDGTAYTVDVLSDGTAKETPVEVGSIGGDRTEITSGLTEGQEVVLADLDAALPTDSSESDSDSGDIFGNDTGPARVGTVPFNGGGPPAGFR